MSEGTEQYDAFMSYSHTDTRVTRRIHSFLQRYRLPDGRRRLRIFRDDTDLRAGELSQELESALSQSRSLVVGCSPSSLDSRWVEREIEAFYAAEEEYTIVPLLLHGDPDKVIPSRCRDFETRYLDLRKGWWWGILSPRYRIELARGIAAIADIPLRAMVKWERRRQMRTAAFAGLLIISISLLVLFWPQNYVHNLEIKTLVGQLRSVEFSEVQQYNLLVVAREVMEGPQGGRNYVAVYPNVFESDAWRWLGVDPIRFHTRLFPISHLDFDDRFRKAIAMTAHERGEAIHVVCLERAKGDKEIAHEIQESLRPAWVGEPSEGTLIMVFPIPPSPVEPGDEGYITPNSGEAVVVVMATNGKATVATLTNFNVQDLSRVDRRAVDLRTGIPVAALGDAIWIGSQASETGAPGGLWSTTDGGATWSRIEEFSSVASIAIDPFREERVLVASAPGRWKSGVREGSRETELWERHSDSSPWKPLEHLLPLSAESRVNFAGFLSDGTLAVQVDSDIYELGRDHFARRLFGSYRRVAKPL